MSKENYQKFVYVDFLRDILFGISGARGSWEMVGTTEIQGEMFLPYMLEN